MPTINTFDTRSLYTGEVRIQTVEGRSIASGYAAVFNSPSEDLGGFREVIRPGAFATALVDADVRALKNHNPDYVLGRNKSGTLRLHEDARGLRFEVDLPDTQYARDLAVVVARGDVTGCSFRFYMFDDPTKGQSWRSEPTGVIREITQFAAIDDVSIVTYPAYRAADVSMRSKHQLEQFEREVAKTDPFILSADVRLRLAEAGF